MTLYPGATQLIMIAAVATLAGCSGTVAAPGGSTNGNTNGDGGTGGQPQVVDTQVPADAAGLLRVGERFIAFAGFDDGGDVITRVYDIQTAEVFDVVDERMGFTNDFSLSGSTLILRGADRGIYQFDAAEPQTLPQRVGFAALAQGRGLLNTDGGDIVAFVTIEPFICWVDKKDDPLRIRTFGVLEREFYTHVAVSGSRAAFFDGTDILVQDTSRPTVPATTYEVNADNTVPIDFDDDTVIYVEADTQEVNLLNLGDGTPTSTGIVYAGGNLSLRGGTACMFSTQQSYSTDEGTIYPSAVVTTSSGSVSTAAAAEPPAEVLPGWGTSCAVGLDGGAVLIAGGGVPLGTDLHTLSWWQDGALNVEAAMSWLAAGVSATNVVVAQNLAAMLLGASEAETYHLGYVTLP